MTEEVLKLSAEGKSQREIAAALGLSQPKVNRLLQKARHSKTGDGSARTRPADQKPVPAAPKNQVGHTLALAQAQMRYLRTCGAQVENLLDVLEDEHPLDRPWTLRDLENLEAYRFTGEEMNGVEAALEQWKCDCRVTYRTLKCRCQASN